MTELTLDGLITIMRECAGEDEAVDLDGGVEDTPFDELGYDSLALMEAASRVGRDYGVDLPEDALGRVRTPGEFLTLVNDRLAAVTAAGGAL
ncbi:Acyl carrier protein [Actinokineospora spheciospongiae]|uniref:Acyl carrier protein n=1 Tax=Actinokineospora spheciospongiae TaxID=909613 RepID=W7ISK5_9PSEU|nr:acyl carrier protein [Actinokineospora spheciospongiae]EWC63333.1 Acyl carrier protein [Actinokineospora spheciospongiae]